MNGSLGGKTILVTGAAGRVRRIFALACARAGTDVVHHGHSEEEAEKVRDEVVSLGCRAWVFQADLDDSSQARGLIPRINESTPVDGLVNSAAIFEALSFESTTLEDWEKHLAVNLTAPFLLSQAFAKQAPESPHCQHRGLACPAPRSRSFSLHHQQSRARRVDPVLSGCACAESYRQWTGPGRHPAPSDGKATPNITKSIPVGRWVEEQEVKRALLFLLTCPAYITGEIMHLDGGRHLV